MDHPLWGTVSAIVVLFLIVPSARAFEPFPRFGWGPLTIAVVIHSAATLALVLFAPRILKKRADALLLLRGTFASAPFLVAFAARAAGGPRELVGPVFPVGVGLIVYSTVSARRSRT